MKVDTISREDIRNVLASIWESDRVAADNLRILLKLIFRWANGAGHRGDNPNNPADGDVVSQLPDIRHEVENYPSLPFQEIKTLISQIEQATGIFLAARLALTLKVLTGTRSGEIVGSRWDDIDMERKIFTPQDETLPSLYWPCLVIPKERTKMGMEMAQGPGFEEHPYGPDGERDHILHPRLIFPASGGGELSRSRLIDLQHRFTKSVPHGLRNSIKSWGQLYRISGDVMETVLGHSISTHRGAYGRAILAGIRIYLMHDWAEYTYGQLPHGYRWSERFFPEEPETYPDETGYMVREDVEALRKHVESDIAGDYYRSIQVAFETLRTAENLVPTHKLATLFMALTGTTATHVLQARVSDVDVDSKTWTIPAENNQRSGAAIQVPLAAPAMDIYTQALNELPRGDSGLLFPSRNDAQIYAARFSDVYRTLRLPIRPSMVRSAFREWLWDWGFPERLIADALGVTQSEPLFVESDTETQAERDWRTRVRMMEQWSDFLHGKRR